MAELDLLEAYRQMLLIRRFEERAAEMYAYGKIGGFLHLYIGEEAVAVGAIEAARPDDDIISHYRDHGYALARGVTADAVMAELFGKATGCTGGRGGSMHLADVSKHFWGGHAIVGGHIPISVGMAFSRKRQGKGQAVLCFFGDGATQIGYFHESLNMASLWKLPVIFVCENNYYGMGTALNRAAAQPDIAKRAEAYNMVGVTCDGMDPVAVYTEIGQALERARQGHGPTLVVCDTFRYRGHSMADPESYRDKGEIEDWRAEDPITTVAARLKESGKIDDAGLAAIETEITRIVDESVRFADQSPDPAPETLTHHVYAQARR